MLEQRCEADNILKYVKDNCGHLTEQETDKLARLLTEYANLFKGKLGKVHAYLHTIDTGEARPVRLPPRRYSPAQHQEIERQIAYLVQNGCIRKSNSPWAAAVVLAPKKDGTWRFAIDYRGLNKVTQRDSYPIPRTDETLYELGKAKYFTTLDMLKGYWQIGVHPADRHKTAFQTRDGLYEWIRMPMGILSASMTYQRMMDTVLKNVRQFAKAYLDDVIIFTDGTFEDHVAHVEQVIRCIDSAGLTARLDKCKFAQPSVEYLGHTVSTEGIMASPRLIEKVKNANPPRSQKELRGFLGLCNYYLDLIDHFSEIAAPLTALTGKNAAFEWTDTQQQAFDKLKHALCTAPVLARPDFSKEFTLHADASKIAVGAVLTQTDQTDHEHPIKYISKKLTPAQQRYGISELECFAVIHGIRASQHFIAGTHVTIVTDHLPLLRLLQGTTQHRSTRLTRWALELQEQDCTIVHRAGSKHQNADAMSRAPIAATASIVSPTHTLTARIKANQRRDRTLAPLIEFATTHTLPQNKTLRNFISAHANNLTLIDNILYYVTNQGNRLLVVDQAHRAEVLASMHDSIIEGGHRSISNTFSKLTHRVWWPNMYSDARQWVEQCQQCQFFRKSPNDKLTRAPRNIPNRVFSSVSVDTITLPRSTSGFRVVFVLIDRLSKYVCTKASKTATAEDFAEWLLHLCLHEGFPDEICSDNGPEYVNKILRALLKILQTKHRRSTEYRPRSNGMVERANQTIKFMLKRYAEEYNIKAWPGWLPFVIFAYNSIPNISTGYSPFFLARGREPRIPMDVELTTVDDAEPSNAMQAVYRLQIALQDARAIATDRLQLAQINRNWAPPENPVVETPKPRYRIGQQVLVYTDHPDNRGKFHNKQMTGPYTIIQPLDGHTNYIVDVQGTHKNMHTARLAPYVAQRPLPPRLIARAAAKHVPLTRTQAKLTHESSESKAQSRDVLSNEPSDEGVSPAVSVEPPSAAAKTNTAAAASDEFEVEAILEKRVERVRSRSAPKRTMYKIRWKGYGPEEDTWEPENHLKGCRKMLNDFNKKL